MYKFTVTYYCSRCHTGIIDTNVTRTGVVFADDREKAISKIRLADNDYICIETFYFEEVDGEKKV